MFKILSSLTLLLTLNIPSQLAIATEPNSFLRVVKTATKGQSNQMHPINISLANGYGVTLSFLPSNQIITKAWLDNRSFVVIDGDGCLKGLPGSVNCSNQSPGAKVLHLKRISDLKIPGLPSTNTSLLTVVTAGPDGGGIYLYRINKATKPNSLVFEMVPPAPSKPLVSSPLITQLERGIKVASTQKNIEDWKNLKPKLRRVVIYLQQGQSLSESIHRSEVSWDLVGQMLELGDNQ